MKSVVTTAEGGIEMDNVELTDDELLLEYDYDEMVDEEHWEGYMKLECKRLA